MIFLPDNEVQPYAAFHIKTSTSFRMMRLGIGFSSVSS